MAASNTGPQFATKKRCRMCNSSNAVAATSCDICGCAFEQPVFVNVDDASAAVVYPSSAGAPAMPSQADVGRASQPRSKPPPAKPTQTNVAEPRQAAPQAKERTGGQAAGPDKAAQPKAATNAAKRPSATADMTQFLRGADDPGVAAQPTWSPMLAWVVVSFVVLVFAVVATAILMAGSTVNGLTR